MIRSLRIAGLVACAGAVVAFATPASAAPDYQLDASGIEQTVLRAQPPKALGAWHQNIYFASDNQAPALCWSTKATQLTLPKATLGGSVGYEMSQNVTAAVSVYQYKSASAASSAAKALASTVCPDSPKVATDSGPSNVIQASAGSDFTSSAKDTLVASVTYKDGDVYTTTETTTTVIGIGVVQTQVTVSAPTAGTSLVQDAHEFDAKWHAQAVKAYTAFGSGGSR